MNRALFLRCGAIFIVIVLLVIPLIRIGGLIGERQAARDAVVQDIARSAAGPQVLTGPLLVVPYTRTVQETQLDASRLPVTVSREVTGELRLLPATRFLANCRHTCEDRHHDCQHHAEQCGGREHLHQQEPRPMFVVDVSPMRPHSSADLRIISTIGRKYPTQ